MHKTKNSGKPETGTGLFFMKTPELGKTCRYIQAWYALVLRTIGSLFCNVGDSVRPCLYYISVEMRKCQIRRASVGTTSDQYQPVIRREPFKGDTVVIIMIEEMTTLVASGSSTEPG